jgi:hypothetical protein
LGLHDDLRAGIHTVVRYKLSLLFTGLFFVSLARGDQTSSQGYDVLKVNHELIDVQGNTQEDIGDLVNRARYQDRLESSGQFTGIRFFVHWKAPSTELHNLIVKIEAHGLDAGSGREATEVLKKSYSDLPGFSGWTTLDLANDLFKKFGKLMAWRVSLWHGNELKASRQSFTWDDSYSSTPVVNKNPNPS